MGNEDNPVFIENNDFSVYKSELIKKIEDLKKAIAYFYGEIDRINRGEKRKYAFPITVDTCMETMNQCYECIDAIRSLDEVVTEEDVHDENLMQINVYEGILEKLEDYSHKIDNKPKEILTKKNAVGVASVAAQETKGRAKRPRVQAVVKPEAAPSPLAPKEEQTASEVKEVTLQQSEVSKSELYQETAITKEAEKVISPQENPVDAEVVTEEIPPPQEVEKIEVEKKPEEKLEVTQPREENVINLQVVTEDNYLEEEIDNDDIISSENDSDNTPILTEEDINEDGNIEKSIDDIVLINNDENESPDLYDYINLPDELSERNIKTISRNQTNGFKARLQKKSIEPSVVSSIKLFPFNENDETIRKDYFASRNNMIAAPQVSRIALLMSGYYIEMSSYGNWDSSSLQRAMRNQTYSFVDKEIAILNSIYDHIKYFSYSQSRPEFEEWLKTVKYPDYDSIFYALYDANNPGMNYYVIDCPYCGAKDISVGKENKDLVVAVDKNYTDDNLIELVTTKEMNKVDNYSYLPKWANTTVIRKMTKDTKILFEYAVPSLYDYVTTLNMANRIAVREKKPLDLSLILEPDSEEYARILLYLYVHRVGLPSPIYGDPSKPKEPTSYKYIGLDSRSDIIEIINSLNNEEFVSLFQGQPIQDLMLKRSIYYYIKDSKCDKCNNVIKYINLNPRKVFFSRI
jgi:hypothetical protein